MEGGNQGGEETRLLTHDRSHPSYYRDPPTTLLLQGYSHYSCYYWGSSILTTTGIPPLYTSYCRWKRRGRPGRARGEDSSLMTDPTLSYYSDIPTTPTKGFPYSPIPLTTGVPQFLLLQGSPLTILRLQGSPHPSYYRDPQSSYFRGPIISPTTGILSCLQLQGSPHSSYYREPLTFLPTTGVPPPSFYRCLSHPSYYRGPPTPPTTGTP